MADVDQTIKALLSNYQKNKNKRKRELSSRLTDKREVLQEQDEKLKYHVCQGGRRRKTTVECQTIPLVKEPEIIIGRDEDKHLLISELLKEDREGHMSYFPFIVITGTAGIGKTTLAQLIYNDAQVEKRFENRIWASISGEFDENKVVEAINESAMGEHAGLITVKHLDAVLKEKITLIVLDNIIDDHQWPFESEANMRSLISIFERMGKGSKIIIITTFKKKTSVDIPSKNQAKSVGRYSTWKYHLNALSPDDSWSIFSSRAFIGRTSEERSELEGIGREIVQLCKGVPLALKTLASALQSMETKSEWELAHSRE